MTKKALISGINFGDVLISNKELFIELFTQYYKQNKASIDLAIANLNTILNRTEKNKLLKTLTPNSAEEFNQAWQQFRQTVLLLNNPLQLMVLYRGSQGQVNKISSIVNQSEFEGVGQISNNKTDIVYGIKTGDVYAKEVKIVAEAIQVEQFLQKHIQDFINQLNKQITPTEAKQLHAYHSKQLHTQYKDAGDDSLSDKLWRQPFYGDSSWSWYSGKSMGQAYDAFMNHIANYQSALFHALSNQSVDTINTDTLRVTRTVFEEEGGAKKYSHFPQLLHDSKNRQSWYSGGDIVIVDKASMAVVYNIQLKSTGINTQSTFGIRIAELRAFIAALNSAHTEREKAEVLFNHLCVTVSNHNDFNEMPQKTIDDLVIKTLTQKNPTLSITFLS